MMPKAVKIPRNILYKQLSCKTDSSHCRDNDNSKLGEDNPEIFVINKLNTKGEVNEWLRNT